MYASRALAILLVVAASSAAAQNTAPRNPLEGVWLRVSGSVDGNVITNQPGYRIFTGGHFSQVWVNGLAPRPPLPASGATAAQVRASLGPLNAAAGTYEVSSMQTYTLRNVVSYGPGGMAPNTYGIYQYRVVADTMWSSQIMGVNGPVATPQIGKYVRVRAGAAGPLEGAWRMVETRNASGAVTRNQPGMRFYVNGHFSTVRVEGMAPRPALPGANATVDELMAVYGPFTAQHGTFEISGGSVTHRFLVTKDPAGMQPGLFSRLTWRIRGDSLWMSQVETQAGPVASPTTTLYVRARAASLPTN
jgi:hypothetical protein